MLATMRVAPHDAETMRTRLHDRIKAPEYPCVGAKAALGKGTLKVHVAKDITSGWDDLAIHDRLLDWAWDYRAEPGLFRSLAVVFEGPTSLDEAGFEDAVWSRIQSLADKDSWRGQSYNQEVSPDPSDPHFSLSFGGAAFFVVGLHPNASRPARRFDHPTMVFNLHDQFEQLRAQNRYEKMRSTILDRDRELAGDINPMLARHGESSEARQYSGRQVEGDWQCPFRDKRA